MADSKRMNDTLTLRMLGENIRLRRYQWIELEELLRGEVDWARADRATLAGRIKRLLDERA